MVEVHLSPHHLPDHLLVEVFIEVEINGDLGRGVGVGIVERRHVGVLQGLGDADPLGGVEYQHPLEKIDGQWVRMGVEGGEGDAGGVGEGLDVLTRLGVVDELEIGVVNGAEDVDDELQLVQAVGAGEDGLAAEQLGEDAADRPDVDGRAVVVAAEEKLRGPVPAGDDILGHQLALAVAGAGQAEVADLELAVGVDQEVPGLQVSVEDVRRVQILERSEQLHTSRTQFFFFLIDSAPAPVKLNKLITGSLKSETEKLPTCQVYISPHLWEKRTSVEFQDHFSCPHTSGVCSKFHASPALFC